MPLDLVRMQISDGRSWAFERTQFSSVFAITIREVGKPLCVVVLKDGTKHEVYGDVERVLRYIEGGP